MVRIHSDLRAEFGNRSAQNKCQAEQSVKKRGGCVSLWLRSALEKEGEEELYLPSVRFLRAVHKKSAKTLWPQSTGCLSAFVCLEAG